MSDEEKDPALRVVDRRWWARGENAPADDNASRKPTYVEDLEQRLADAATELQNHLVEQRRAIEEFEQVKLRLRRDTSKEVERGKRQILVEFLDVVDNLDRAIAAAEETPGSATNEAVEKLARGVRLVRDQFLSKLEAFGVFRAPALGERFDAVRHEAVTTASVASEAEHGTVIAVIKEGYVIGDELLRPASVVVGSYGQG